MKIRKCAAVLALGLTLASTTAFAVKVGDPAPDFTAKDSLGHTVKLDAYKGKYVVLEWTNNTCPFTKKHYESGNMQSLQKQWTGKGVIWLSVLSSAPGHEGYMTAAQENAYMAQVKAVPTAAILDGSGALGHEYEAKTTPHMFVIDPSGKLIYAGAIDDHADPDPSDIKISKNYVSEALGASMAGLAVPTAYTRAYGCSVKYAGE